MDENQGAREEVTESETGPRTLKKKLLAAGKARAEGRLAAEDFSAVNIRVRATASRPPISIYDLDPTDDVIIMDLDPTDAPIIFSP